MANPFGIEQVDVPGILGVYQGAQDRRVNQMLLQRKMAAEDRAIENQETISNIYKNLRDPSSAKGGGQSTPAGGLASAYAPSSPAPAATPPASFNPSMPTGSPLSPATFPQGAPQTSPALAPAQATAPAQTPPPGWYEANKPVVDQLMSVAPEKAFELMNQLKGMDDTQLKHIEVQAQTMAHVGEHLHSFPEGTARQAEVQRITPDLVASGIPLQKIQQVDTSDKGLQWLVVQGTDLTKLWAHEKDERDAVETERSHRANEATAAGNLGVREGALSLARGREKRVGAKGTTGDVGGLSTADLIRMAGGE